MENSASHRPDCLHRTEDQFIKHQPRWWQDSRNAFIGFMGLLMVMTAISTVTIFKHNAKNSDVVSATTNRLIKIEHLNELAKDTRIARLEFLLNPNPETAAILRQAQTSISDAVSDLFAEQDLPFMTEDLRLLRNLYIEIASIAATLTPDEIRQSFLSGVLHEKTHEFFDTIQTAYDREAARKDNIRRHYEKLSTLIMILLGLMLVLTLISLMAMLIKLRQDEAIIMRTRYLEDVAAERDRADILARELSHRVKNLFAVISSIVTMTARTESDAQTAAKKTRARIQALARAHEISTGSHNLNTQQNPTKAIRLLDSVVVPYRPGDATLTSYGDEVELPTSMTTPIGLIFNELATNALKYGAWSNGKGQISVHIVPDDEGQMAQLQWIESGGPDCSDAQQNTTGFGTTMIDLSLKQINGVIERNWSKTGLDVTMRLNHAPTMAEGKVA